MRQSRDWEPAGPHDSDSADFSDEDSSACHDYDDGRGASYDTEISRSRDVHIVFGEGKLKRPQPKDWPDNRIKTTKYTWYNFVVLNLYEQLHKFATVYFLAISLLMYLGQKRLFVGTIKYFTTLAQQVLLMCASGAIALRDDMKRGEADKAINESKVECYSSKRRVIENSEPKKWKDVKVGDILRVRKDQEFPADVVPLCSSGEGGNLYVSTANLDGETNLKLKTALESTQSVFWDPPRRDVNEEKLRRLECSLEAEPPKESIHDFKGSLSLSAHSGRPCMSLGPEQLLLRGTVLRNTDFVVGVVVYTGKNTRMVLNSRSTPMKQSNIEKTTNQVMYVVLATQALLALLSDIAYLKFRPTLEKHWYLFQNELILPIPLAYWLTFFVLYSNLMPITLYATTDFCNFFHAYFIRNDKKVFYKEMSFPAGVRSTNLCQELGQVSYIFSDKTGTLTQNVMELKRVFIGDRAYGDKKDGFASEGDTLRAARAQHPNVAAFFEVLAVCHTVMVSEDAEAPGALKYEAESPDDGALVNAAAEQACVFLARRGKTLIVEVAGQRREYTVVATNAFTSARKRMSVVVQREQEYLLLAKGADNVMLPLARGHAQGGGSRELERALDTFSREGLRTLVIARRTLDAAFVRSWLEAFNKANADLGDREGALERVAAQVESDLELLGATAIEDKLQDGVQRTIQKIRDGGIKFWVLTGDKLETAREIGFSANVLTPDMMIHVVDRDVRLELNSVLRLVSDQGKGDDRDEPATVSALMITGAALMEVMASKQLQRALLKVTQECAILMACRVSPLQKSQLVQLVRDNVQDDLGRPVVTLAIGDGANDVPMIQTAQVGVGIAGKEGRQSVNNADFAIGQFEYLERLLFLHGRWNYLRACKFTLFTFWRNAVQVLMIVFYTFISGCFSGTALFEESIRITFNAFGTFPIIATGLFDQDVDEATALENAQLYRVGREQVQLSVMKMVWTLISALSHSLILQLVCYCAFPGMDLLGVGDYYSFGTACFTCLLIDVFYRNIFLAYTHNMYTVAVTLACVGGYVLFCVILCVERTYSTPALNMVFSEPNMLKVPWELAKVKTFWVCVVCAPMMAMAFDTFIDFLLDAKLSETQMSLREDRKEALAMSRKGAAGHNSDSEEEREEADAHSPLLFLKACCEFQAADEDEECKYEGLDLSDFAQQTVPTLVNVDWFQTEESRRMNRNAVCVIGIILVVFGALSYSSAHSNKQVKVVYAGERLPWLHGIYDSVADLFTKPPVTVHSRSAECSGLGQCTFSLELFDSDDDILIAYQVGPFFQNQNDYESSVVFAELQGKTGPEVDRKREEVCWKEETRQIVEDGQVRRIVPCGMKATSVFNDTFEIVGAKVSFDDLAWESDIDWYANPKGYLKDGETSWLPDRYPEPIVERPKGVKSQHFAAWMRIAALDIVGKRWGWIRRAENGNFKGGNVTVTINNNFDVSAWGGCKQLVFTQLSKKSGSSLMFAHFLIACGVLCFVEAMLFTIWLWSESLPCEFCHPESDNE